MPAPVTIWTTTTGDRRDGWTVSSMMVADGDPAEVIGLLDEDADFTDLVRETGRCTVNLLGSGQGPVAEAFARVAPSPGGPFRTGEWSDGAYGPRLVGAAGWLGVRLLAPPEDHAGWTLLARGVIEAVELTEEVEALLHVRGRYA
jgi:flavin reductase (DIM6/NTAB) family NADH-FMN oxidoreductase RutF